MLRNLSAIGRVGGLCVLLSACSLAESKQRAEACVGQFHAMLDGERYADIRAQMGPAARGQLNEPDAKKLFSAVHRKLGSVKSASLSGWRINREFGGGDTTSLTYTTEFSKGMATETFVIVADEISCRLDGYNVNSMALLSD